MITIATCLWRANEKSEMFSQMYDEPWVEKLYRAFKRHLTMPFRFVLFVDQLREFNEEIEQRLLISPKPYSYGCMIEPFSLDVPSIILGLDTVIIRNIDHYARYCLEEKPGGTILLPRDPYNPHRSINAIALVPAGRCDVFENWNGENDMEWLRTVHGTGFIDDHWPNEVISMKFHKVRAEGVTKQTHIVYFHGVPKPHQLGDMDLIKRHWV